MTNDGFVFDDGGRKAAGLKGYAGDCVCRSICIVTGLPYADVYKRLAADPGFWAFLRSLDPVHFGRVANEQDAATAVRQRCGVNTRSDFDAYDSKARLWDELYSNYQLERRGAMS